jgi:hypothetical protein
LASGSGNDGPVISISTNGPRVGNAGEGALVGSNESKDVTDVDGMTSLEFLNIGSTFAKGKDAAEIVAAAAFCSACVTERTRFAKQIGGSDVEAEGAVANGKETTGSVL